MPMSCAHGDQHFGRCAYAPLSTVRKPDCKDAAGYTRPDYPVCVLKVVLRQYLNLSPLGEQYVNAVRLRL